MPAILEPIEAGIVVALINKYVINNHKICDYLCGTKGEEEKREQGEAEEDSSSMTTSITGTDFSHTPHLLNNENGN